MAILTYLAYGIVILFGHARDLMRKLGIEKSKLAVERNRPVGLNE